MNVYVYCPTFENDRFLLRLVVRDDASDLLKVYSDVKAVPLFNSDNCHGDDFYYTTMERMQSAVDFWIEAYQKGWFVRWSVVDKNTSVVVGTIEEFLRESDDYFTDCGLLRLDLRSDYEKADEIANILSLIVTPSYDMFGCKMIATKALPIAVNRRQALIELGFSEVDHHLVGFDGTKYCSYFVTKR